MGIIFHTVCLEDHGNLPTHFTADCSVVFWSQLHRKPGVSVSLSAKFSILPTLLVTGTKYLTEHLKESRIHIGSQVQSSPPALEQDITAARVGQGRLFTP